MGLPRLTVAGVTVALSVASAGCLEPTLDVALSLAELRPDAADGGLPQPLYEPGVIVRRHDSPQGNFRVHYATEGASAVPLADSNVDGTPDYVVAVAAEYERVLAFYRDTLGFLPPNSDLEVSDGNGGDGRFDVYLLDFPTGADGSYRSESCTSATGSRCGGYMLQENDFNGRRYTSLDQATRILASHELFHAVQSAYVASPSSVLGEATAVWASERYDPSLDDFEAFVRGYLARPERSLLQEPSGPPDAFSYGAALLFRQLEESYDDALVRLLWEELARSSAPQGFGVALDRVLSLHYQSSLAEAYTRFARWNLYTEGRADGALAYAEGARYPRLTEQPLTLPFYDELVRMLPLSTRAYVVEPTGSELSVALGGERAERTGLRWLLAVERAGRITRVLESSAETALSSGLVERGLDKVHVMLIDTRAEGVTQRVAVCLGRADDLTPCGEPSLPAAPLDAGLPSDTPDPTGDASSAPPIPPSSVDAGADGAVVLASDAGVSTARRPGASGCSSVDATSANAADWLTSGLLVVATLWVRRPHRQGRRRTRGSLESRGQRTR